MASPRLHVYLGRGAELELTQDSEGNAENANALLDFVLDEGARLTFVDRAEGGFQAIRGSLKRDSKMKAVLLGKVLRHSVKVQLAEENSEAEIFGLNQLKDSQESHVHAAH